MLMPRLCSCCVFLSDLILRLCMACSTSQLLRYFKVENGARRALAHAAIRQKVFAIAYGHVRVLDSKISAGKK